MRKVGFPPQGYMGSRGHVWTGWVACRTLAGLLALLLALVSPALAGSVRCTTDEERSMGRLQTVCDDGPSAVSTWSPTLQRWHTTITESPRRNYQGCLNPRTKHVEVRCQ
jgi:hypothetical protein